MSAMEWVQDSQGECEYEWDIHKTVSEVRASFEESKKKECGGWDVVLRKYLQNSRAVRVNGQCNNLRNIPEEFAQILFGGAKTIQDLNGQERNLTINGFLVPEREESNGELLGYDWNMPTKVYGVSNSLMAEYYGDMFPSFLQYQKEMIKVKEEPKSGSDLLARIFPFMAFATVVDKPIPSQAGELETPLSAGALPYEDHYKGAMVNVLKDMKYTVSTPLNNKKGKIDVVVTLPNRTTCSIETNMAKRSQDEHNEHAQGFSTYDNYRNAALKILV